MFPAHACINAHTHTCAHTCRHTHMHVHAHAHTSVCLAWAHQPCMCSNQMQWWGFELPTYGIGNDSLNEWAKGFCVIFLRPCMCMQANKDAEWYRHVSVQGVFLWPARSHPLFRYFALAWFSLVTSECLTSFFFREEPLYSREDVYKILNL